MKGLQKQRGMTAIGWIIVLGLIAFFTLVILRLTPLYLEYSKVSSVLESLENEPGITRQSKVAIQTLISRRFEINDVRNVDPKTAVIESRNGRLTVTMDYERRTNMAGNIDLVVSFNKSIEVIAN
ncbi:MAG: DUF4845 domain-containing protein [Gammaproteobacteria bacterium]